MNHVDGWHFADKTLRDGTPHPDVGVTLPEIPNLKPCLRGYHASPTPLQALQWAPGPYVARVRLHGVVIPHGDPIDKYVASMRTQLTPYVDATDALRLFTRQCALDVIHLWNAPDVVRKFLETGYGGLRANAERAVAKARTRGAAGIAAQDAAWAAVQNAAQAAVAETSAQAAVAETSAQAAAQDTARAAAQAARHKQNAHLTALLEARLETTR